MCQVEGTAHVQAQRQDRDLLKACPLGTSSALPLLSPNSGARPWEISFLNRRYPGSDVESSTSPRIIPGSGSWLCAEEVGVPSECVLAASDQCLGCLGLRLPPCLWLCASCLHAMSVS